MSGRTLVDVGLPTRRSSAFIGESVASVLAQTLENWSLLVSKNGPGDGELTSQLQPFMGDPRIHQQTTAKEVGAAKNHTLLIESGSAPYVAILHDDDRWDPEFLQRRVDFLEQHPECGFVFSGNREIDKDSKLIGESRLVLSEGVHEPQDFVPMLVRHNLIGIPTVLVRRSAYVAVGPKFDEETVFFDYEMWLRLALAFPVGYLAIRDADYRIHRTQITMTARDRGAQQLRLLDQIEAHLAAAPHVTVDRRSLQRRRARAHLTRALDALESPEPQVARRHVALALRTYPAALFDPRIPLIAVGLVLGTRARRALRRLRFLVLWKRFDLHLRR